MEIEEVNKILKKAKRINSMILLATKAYHRLGDASQKKLRLCFVSRETEKFFIGYWRNSYLFDVVFPKETTKKISSVEEIKKYLNPYHIHTMDLGY